MPRLWPRRLCRVILWRGEVVELLLGRYQRTNKLSVPPPYTYIYVPPEYRSHYDLSEVTGFALR